MFFQAWAQYRDNWLRPFDIEKNDVQRALLTILEPRSEKLFHNDSYAYRPGRSVAMALKKVKERVQIGQYWLVDADIKSFFNSIPHKQLNKLLKDFLRDAKAFELIEKWLIQGAHHQSFLGSHRGISHGAILSPLFCNLYLHQFDTALNRVNIPFVRFADDFLLFSSDKDKAERAMQFAEDQLLKLGLSLHPEKSQIIQSSPTVKFLGKPLPQVRQ